MKILICGDSYCVTDPSFPGLHWSEKILDRSHRYEILNLAYGGCSNALIVMQLLQGLRLQPDFVVLSFTDFGRYEIDKDPKALPADMSSQEIAWYLKERYVTNNYDIPADISKIINQYRTLACSENLEKLKNYFFISFCLMTLRSSKINFAFSLGGFEYDQDYTVLLNSNFVKNLLQDFHDHELPLNLWYHGRELSPFFHVKDDKVQTLFANQCIEMIESKC